MRNVRIDFLDRVKVDYWFMCYMSQKQCEDYIKLIWDELKVVYGMFKLVVQFVYNYYVLIFNEMFSCMKEFQIVIDLVNLIFVDEQVKYLEKFIMEYWNVMEVYIFKYVSNIKKRIDIGEQEKQQFIK